MMTALVLRRLAFGATVVALGLAACGQPSAPVAAPPMVFPDHPIVLTPGALVQLFVYVGPSWETPTPQNGIVCSTRDSIVEVGSDCKVIAGATPGTTTVVVDRYGGKTDVPISVVAYPHFRLPAPAPGVGSATAVSVALDAQGVGYVTEVGLGQFLWRLDLNGLRADPALVASPPPPPRGGAFAAAFNTADTRLYAPGFLGGLAVVDVASNTVTDTLPGFDIDVYATLLAPGDSTLYVGARDSLLAFDLVSDTVRARLPEPGQLFTSLALDAAAHRLYAVVYSDFRAGAVLELDPGTLAPLRTVAPVASGAKRVFLPGGADLYVVSESNQLLDCSLAGAQSCATVPEKDCLGNGLAFTGTGTELYLSCGEMIRVLDAATLRTVRYVIPYGALGGWLVQAQPGTPSRALAVSGFDLTLLP